MPIDNVNVSGKLNKIGTPVNGKQVYEAKDEQNKKKFTYTVPQENIDKFEKLYGEMDNIVADIATPEAQEKLHEQGKNFGNQIKTRTLIGTIAGAVIPAAIAIFSKGKVWKRALFGTLSSLAGAALGAWGTAYVSVRLGLRNILQANQDIQKLQEISAQMNTLGVETKQEDITA